MESMQPVEPGLFLSEPINTIPRIWNHDIMNCTDEAVAGNYLYSARALGLTEPGDVIQLHPALATEWDWIQAHYDRVGLSYTRDVLWDVNFNQFGQYGDYQPTVFIFDESVNFAHRDDDWLKAVVRVNSKNSFMALAELLGVTVPKTFCFNHKHEIKTLKQFPYPCYAKAAVSVSGVGIYRCESEIDLLDALKLFDDEVPLQIQQEIPTEVFLNVQYEITDQGMKRLAITEQILDGYAHQGNRHPACCEPWDAVEPMAQWLAQNGMKGIFAFDVAVWETEAGYDHAVIECNPRYNGASYPSGVADKLGIKEWFSEMLKTSKRSFSELDFSDLEYNGQTDEGVIVVNWGPISVGKIGFLIAGSKSRQLFYREQLLKRLA